MALTNTATSYGAVTKGFHWLTALMIITLIPLGFIAHDMGDRILSGSVPPDQIEAFAAQTVLLFSIHKTLGIFTFFVALLRILWAISQPKPGLLMPKRSSNPPPPKRSFGCFMALWCWCR